MKAKKLALTEFDTTEDLAERSDEALRNMLDSIRGDLVTARDFIVAGTRTAAGHPLRRAAKQLNDAMTILNLLCAHEERVSSEGNLEPKGIQA